MPPLRVVHIIWHLGVGGGELFLRDLALALARHDLDQEVWTIGDGGPAAGALDAAGIRRRSYRKSTKAGLGTMAAMTRDLRRSGASLVHLHGEGGLLWGSVAAALARVPAIALMYMNERESVPKMFLYRRLLRRAAVVVAGSRAVGAFLDSAFRVEPSRVRVVPCGIDATTFASTPRRPRQAGVVVSVGRLVPRKGHHVLIDAFGAVLSRIPDAVLQIVGDGPERPRLERQAQARGVAGRVQFRGTVYPSNQVLASADLFVFPSLEEPQGLALLEAMACGVPVVASRAGGIVDMIEHDVDGWLVPPGDVPALAGGIVRLLSDAPRRDRYADHARQRVAAFDIHRLAEQYLALYAETATTAAMPRGAEVSA